VDIRWTRHPIAANDMPQIDITTLSFGRKNHIIIDQRYGFISKSAVAHGK
jgi:hypothetical protein